VAVAGFFVKLMQGLIVESGAGFKLGWCCPLLWVKSASVTGENLLAVKSADTIIVGEIPSSYYNLEGMTRDNAINIIE